MLHQISRKAYLGFVRANQHRFREEIKLRRDNGGDGVPDEVTYFWLDTGRIAARASYSPRSQWAEGQTEAGLYYIGA